MSRTKQAILSFAEQVACPLFFARKTDSVYRSFLKSSSVRPASLMIDLRV